MSRKDRRRARGQRAKRVALNCLAGVCLLVFFGLIIATNYLCNTWEQVVDHLALVTMLATIIFGPTGILKRH